MKQIRIGPAGAPDPLCASGTPTRTIDPMNPTRPWAIRELREPFLAQARPVLNAQVHCVEIEVPQPITDDPGFLAAVRDVLGDPRLGGPLTAAVLEHDPIEGYRRTLYTPPTGLHSLAGSTTDEPGARRRLESMLIPRTPYRSPCGRTTSPERARELVTSFLNAFTPRPIHFAEVDPVVLQGWTFIDRGHHAPPFPETLDLRDLVGSAYDVSTFPDGFHDSVLAIGAGPHLALLVNNGSD